MKSKLVNQSKKNLVKAAGISDSQPAEDPKDTIPTWFLIIWVMVYIEDVS